MDAATAFAVGMLSSPLSSTPVRTRFKQNGDHDIYTGTK